MRAQATIIMRIFIRPTSSYVHYELETNFQVCDILKKLLELLYAKLRVSINSSILLALNGKWGVCVCVRAAHLHTLHSAGFCEWVLETAGCACGSSAG
jgi:hypothetical protein